VKINKHYLTISVIALAIALMISPAHSASKKMQNNQGFTGVQSGTSGIIASLPYEELSAEEELGLIQMREEEKLARDVYATLYDIWQVSVFNNISQSEQRHMNAVKVLIDKYELIDPVIDSSVGVFTDPAFTGLYALLVDQGSESLVDALIVGATIEDLDIKDLQELLIQTDNEDITAVYENLLSGSRNHLRAFTYLLSLNGETYEAQFITPEELEAIITSPREAGSRNGKNNVSGSGNTKTVGGNGTGECVNY
jgi:hypothetical protein